MTTQCPKCKAENPDESIYCGKCASTLKSFEENSSITKTIKKSTSELGIGSIFAGRYRITDLLGRGGMGVVYKTEDTKLRRTVALKLLPSELTLDSEAKERFIFEAQAAAGLDHTNICTVFEIDEAEGNLFISMAYLEGPSLKERIKQSPLKLEEVLDIAIQVAEGMDEAHKKGVIHRDIKSANIMLTEKGQAKIMDFGLAKSEKQRRITKVDTIMGTIAFMSPEQAQGVNVDHRTDIWSLGVVLYEMVTSECPFKRDTDAAVIHSIIYESPIPPTELRLDIPTELEQVILKCLRKEMKDRYQSMRRLILDLTKITETLEKTKHKAEIVRGEVPKTEREVERRQATVMFVEVSRYTEMLEKMDDEEVASVMSRCFEIFGSIEEKYGGMINKVTSHRFTAFFGVPTAIENAPKSAVNAAIELRNNFYRFLEKEQMEIPLDIRIGINTGMVIAGTYSVMGETVNIASRLKDLSGTGQIYVGLSTYRYTSRVFDYKKLKPMVLEGRDAPVHIFELLSTREKIYRARLGADRMINSEMVGRDEELAKLELHVLKASNNEGSIVNVIGEAGIGKSRLITELKKVNAMKRVILLEGRALSIGKNLSFHPIIDIFKNWAEIEENDNPSVAAHKLERIINEIYSEGTAEVFPFIGTLMGLNLPERHAERVKGIEGEALEKLILKNLRLLVEKAAEKKPLVLIVEDLHWADQTSIEFFRSLYRLVENNPILYINVFRPNYEGTSNRILDTVKDRYSPFYSEIYLESLNEKESEVLINNLLKVKELPSRISNLIIDRAEGNPFFIEEVMRSFIDDGVIKVMNGRFKITEKIDSVVIPQTINEVLMARIDNLDEKTKSLLRIGSVIGRNFFYKILAGVAESVQDIDIRLEDLKEAQLVLERRRLAELEYQFKHALVQEITYESILLKKRKELHLKIANSIESVFSERLHEFYGMLAFHYGQGEDLDKAEEFLIKAGAEALKSSASREAFHHYREALNIYLGKYGKAADPGKVAMLEKNIALALFNRGSYVEADEYFTKVLSYYGEKLPKGKMAIFFKFLRGFLGFLMSLYIPFLNREKTATKKDSEIINLFYKKNTALIVTNPRRMFIESFYWLKRLFNFDLTKIENGVGIVSMSGAAFSYSGVSFRISKKVSEFVKDKVDKNDVKAVLYYEVPEVVLGFFSGDWDHIKKYDDNLVNLNVRIGELFYSSSYILTHGYYNTEIGYFAKAMEMAQKLSEIGEEYENTYARAQYHRLSIKLFMKYRKFNDALLELEKELDFLDKTGYGRPMLVAIYAYKAKIQLMMGDLEGAASSLEFANNIRQEMHIVSYFYSDFLMSQFNLDLYRIEELKRSGNKPELASSIRRALRTGKKAVKISKKAASDRTEAFKLMGTCYWIKGNKKNALKWWEKSVNEGTRLGAKLELSRTFKEVGMRLLEKESRFNELNGIGAKQYLEKAKDLFREMGLQQELEELEVIDRP